MKRDEVERVANLFVEKAEKLLSNSFLNSMRSKSGVSISGGAGKPMVISRRGPHDESIESFVLTFRYFIQDNEVTSIRNIGAVFNSAYANENEKLQYEYARKKINHYLDEPSAIVVDGGKTRREMMYVFIFGGLSHANKEKKTVYDGWTGNIFTKALLENEFTRILFNVLMAIKEISKSCKSILGRMR